VLELTPDLVGPSVTEVSGIIGQSVNMGLDHLSEMRLSTLAYNLAKRLLYTKWRDSNEEPKLHLFGPLKRITKQWLDSCLHCKGGTYPALLMYDQLADMACNRITAGITLAYLDTRPVKAMLAFNPTGSTKSVNFNTSRETLWQTNSERCHVNYVVYDSGWEAEFCRVAESHPIVKAYVKNHGLNFRVPYRYGSEVRTYIPDFIVVLGEDDPLHLVVEIKGYRREDAKEKKLTMETLWVPGVNNLGSHGRWAFAEFGEVYQIESNFQVKVEQLFNQMIDAAIPQLVS
jgi:type III restriction enzyme